MSLACPSLIADVSPALCRAVQNYCERTSTALDAEPINALTNAAFLLAAWAVWRLQSRDCAGFSPAIVRALAVCTAVVGLGSFLFHTVATRWSEWGDVLPILGFMLLFLWASLGCFLGWSGWTRLSALAVFFAVTFTLEAVVPGEVLHGGALYAPALFSLIALAATVARRHSDAGKALIGAAGVFLLSLAARTIDIPICRSFRSAPISFGT